MNMENLLKNLEELREQVIKTTELLKLEGRRSEAQGLERQMNEKNFWSDSEKAKIVSQRAADLRDEINKWDELIKEITELEELTAVAQKEKETDDSLSDELHDRFNDLTKEFMQLEFLVLFSGKYDASNAIISIHAGTGGVDAQDWAQLLERMYLRFAESKKWLTAIVERTIGNEAGLKSVMIKITGRWAYGFLKSEAGVHRLVRISPFDGEKMRHTSFALVEVIPELPETANIELKDEELKIDVFKSSGPGGQGVNTTDSAVRITHLPSKIVVVCQNERSQQQNKETALTILRSKLFQQEEEKKQAEEVKLRGENLAAEWGNQIRSYVMQPYKMVKDHRANFETPDVDAVLDGELTEFIEAYLKWRAGKK